MSILSTREWATLIWGLLFLVYIMCHKEIRKLFEKYRRRLSPYCSVASLYFWVVAGGAIPEMKDYAPKKENKKNERAREIASNSKQE